MPLPTVEKIHKDFATTTGNDNRMDKREFRHLYKKMYVNSQPSSLPSALPPLFNEDELNKLSDYVFDTYDFDGAGMRLSLSSIALFPCSLGHLTFEGRTAQRWDLFEKSPTMLFCHS